MEMNESTLAYVNDKIPAMNATGKALRSNKSSNSSHFLSREDVDASRCGSSCFFGSDGMNPEITANNEKNDVMIRSMLKLVYRIIVKPRKGPITIAKFMNRAKYPIPAPP